MENEEQIRVLIADDSFFIRKYLSALLRADPSIAIVGEAADGNAAVQLASTLHPDVITMDYHMPGKNGIEAAAAIMLGARPLPAIIMLSAFNGADGKEIRTTLEASGAHILVKPSGEVSLDIERIAEDILVKIKEVGAVQLQLRRTQTHVPMEDHRIRESEVRPEDPSAVIVIGASTGGPPLVEHLLSSLDPKSGVSVVIVQHMSKYFTELFAERLDRVTGFDVREAYPDDVLLPGLALVVPGGMSLDCSRDVDSDSLHRARLVPASPSGDHHEEEIDGTMEAVAGCFGSRAYGVLLSGMGSDGSRGLAAIKMHGGHTIVQDPRSATISSMPAHAIETGSVDVALPAEQIGEYLQNALASRHVRKEDVIQ